MTPHPSEGSATPRATIPDWKALGAMVGQLVIVGEIDAPEAGNIAVVTNTGCNGKLRIRYLAKKVARGEFAHAVEASLTSLTLVRDFGVAIEFRNGLIVPVQTPREAVATYDDGSPRKWQGGERCAEIAAWARSQKRFQDTL